MTLALTRELIARPSVTPDDAGCQQLIGDRLKKTGFTVTHLPSEDVSNLWATHGTGAPVFTFLGHTDVVPPGRRQTGNHRRSNPGNGMATCTGAARPT